MTTEMIAWMPTEHEDLETAQYLLAIQFPKGIKLGVREFRDQWVGQIAELLEQSEDLEAATEHLASKLESLGLLPEWVDPGDVGQMLHPMINTRISDLLGAWGITDLVPNKVLTETDKKAEWLIKSRDSSTWVDSLRYP